MGIIEGLKRNPFINNKNEVVEFGFHFQANSTIAPLKNDHEYSTVIYDAEDFEGDDDANDAEAFFAPVDADDTAAR
jgi:hypothetical protein